MSDDMKATINAAVAFGAEAEGIFLELLVVHGAAAFGSAAAGAHYVQWK